MAASKKSLMPEGFEKQVTAGELTTCWRSSPSRGKYLPLDLSKAATIVSTRGMFYDADSPMRAADLPRLVAQDRRGRAVPAGRPPGQTASRTSSCSTARSGEFPPRMPKSVELPCNAPARAIHFLSGVSGWGYPGGRKGTRLDDRPAPLRRRHGRGPPLENGVQFADYIRVVDVPGSKLAFNLRGQQIRYFAVAPKKKDPIDRIELVKGPDQTAPVVMAVTVEVGGKTVSRVHGQSIRPVRCTAP